MTMLLNVAGLPLEGISLNPAAQVVLMSTILSMITVTTVVFLSAILVMNLIFY